MGQIPVYRPLGAQGGPRGALGSHAGASSGLRRRQVQKRRRDVFVVLLAAAGVTLVASFIPGLHGVIYLQVLSDLLLAGYVALLLRMRNLSAERDMKLTYLPDQRRLAAPPEGYRSDGRDAASAYSTVGGYRGLALRRAAN